MGTVQAQIQASLSYLQERIKSKPRIGLILGSGLGDLATEIGDKVSIPYAEIPHFPVSTVEGHAGQLVFGRLRDQEVVAMQGRFHYYEGYSAKEVVYPVWVMRQLGVETLIVTNAAGGINSEFKSGALVLIRDHINLTGVNPLTGVNDPLLGPRFPDMSEAYDGLLRELALKTAVKKGIELKQGVYCALAGPSYETPAEIRFLRVIGADQVGMSTALEVIAANHCGMKVLGISCITNMAAGILPQKLSHAEVMETADRIKDEFMELVASIVEEM